MTLNLRKEIREPLVEKLADILARAEVSNNWFLDHRIFSELSDLEGRLAKKNQFWERCEEFINDRPLVTLFHELLSDELRGSRKYDFATNKILLRTLVEYGDTISLSERLIRYFESLPREYKCFVRLPLMSLKDVLGEQQYQLSDALSLIFTDDQHELNFPAAPFTPPTRELTLFSFGQRDVEHKLN